MIFIISSNEYDYSLRDIVFPWCRIIYITSVSKTQKEAENMYKPGKYGYVPNVAWWRVGNKALATSEYPGGHMVDVHKLKDLGDYEFSDDNFNQDWYGRHSPSHEQYENWNDPNGKIWHVISLEKREGDILHTKRGIYTLDPTTQMREIIGEYSYADADLARCSGTQLKRFIYRSCRCSNIMF